VLEFARSRRLATLTVTDSTFSPLRGQVSLYAPAESASFVAFHCAPLVLLNALVHELSVADEKKDARGARPLRVGCRKPGIFLKGMKAQ
jgi:DNA-binding MurR/RpiR family transcriptional regulator